MSLVITSALFALLSFTPNSNKIINSLLFIVTYWTIAKAMGIILTRADLIVPMVLFLALSPGLSNTNTVLIRTLLFALIFALLRKFFPQYY